MSFLSPDSEFMNMISKCVDYILLNLLCALCCIPVITIGASLTAKYYVSMKLVRGEEPVVSKAFFHAFRENFRQSTAVWAILAVMILVLALDWYLIWNAQEGVMNPAFTVFLVVLSTLIAGIVFCVFPMLARFQISTVEVLKGAGVFALMKLPRVLLSLAVTVLTYFVGFWYLEWFLAIWILSTAVMLYYNSRMFVKEFKRLEEPEEEVAEDEKEENNRSVCSGSDSCTVQSDSGAGRRQ